MKENKIMVLTGEFTFYDPFLDGKHEAVIHRITGRTAVNTGDLDAFCGETTEDCLIPAQYDGTIINESGT